MEYGLSTIGPLLSPSLMGVVGGGGSILLIWFVVMKIQKKRMRMKENRQIDPNVTEMTDLDLEKGSDRTSGESPSEIFVNGPDSRIFSAEENFSSSEVEI